MVSVSGVFPTGGVDTLYTCDNGRGLRVENFRVVNVSGGAIQINVWIKQNSTDRRIAPVDQNLDAGTMYQVPTPFHMHDTDTIEVDSTDGANTEFHISGVEFGNQNEAP
jgi:hypothetical protein